MNTMEQSPVEQVVDELEANLAIGRREPRGYNADIAISSGERAVRGLRAVLAAVGDLEPGPALIVNDALRSGLGVTR